MISSQRNWAGRTLLITLCALAGAVACTQGVESSPSAPADPEVRSVTNGWMGRFAAKDEALRQLLTSNRGWEFLRDMELFEAIQFFESGTSPADRIGAARSYLQLAELSRSLDALFLTVEGDYLSSGVDTPTSEQRARRALILLRQGHVDEADSIVEQPIPEHETYAWTLARAAVAVAAGKRERAKQQIGELPAPPGADARNLRQVFCFLHGLPLDENRLGPYDHALEAFARGDLTGGVLSLQMLEFSGAGEGASPELYLYRLLRWAFAGLAERSLQGLDGPGPGFLRAQARLHRGEDSEAAAALRATAQSETPVADAALLFSPVLGQEEWTVLSDLAADSASGERTGKDRGHGPQTVLEIAARAAHAAEADGDGSEFTAEDAEDVLRRAAEVPAAVAKSRDALDVEALYAARRAELSRYLARYYWSTGRFGQAMDAMERGHRKASGNRPDFTNPPAFLVDLARARIREGQYAPAVAVLFELASDYPSVRVAYESLKRLYASRTGGEVPPR